MKALLLALLIAAGPAFSETLLATNGSDSVRLTPDKCALEPAPGEWRAAVVTLSKKKYVACWTIATNTVLLRYEDGDQGMIPIGVFKIDPGV